MPTILKVAPTETPYDALTREQIHMFVSALRGISKTTDAQLNNAAIDAVTDKIEAEQIEQFGYLRRPTIGEFKHGFDGIVDISDSALKLMIDAVTLVIRGVAISQLHAQNEK